MLQDQRTKEEHTRVHKGKARGMDHVDKDSIFAYFWAMLPVQEVNEGIADIFREVVRLGGTLSGEHGIGIAKRPYMHLAMDEANLRLMRGIKGAFDPNGILNPGKIF